MAVYRALDIGLCYDFDHYRVLRENETPTTWLLQARAAKSAVEYAHRLHNSKEKEILEKTKDPEERERKIREHRQNATAEIQFIANRLSDLIPTDVETLEYVNERDKRLDLSFLLNRRSPVIDNLLQNYLKKKTKNETAVADEIDYLNPMKNADDDYLAAWQARYQNGMNSTKDEDGDPEIHLC